MIAADCRRLSTSCLQSISTAQNTKSELPWSLVRLYYSAFYAAHVVVRLLGSGCCWLDQSHANRILAVGVATGVIAPFPIDQGAYRCLVGASGDSLAWTKTGSGSRGGAHEALWSILDLTLSEASNSIAAGLLPRADAQAVIGQIESFRTIARARGSKSWLSTVRNDLQYRLDHDVWHPTSVGKQDRARLQRLSAQWATDPMDIDLSDSTKYGVTGQFCAACAFVIAIFRVLSLRVESRSSGRQGCFVRHGARAFANYAHIQIG